MAALRRFLRLLPQMPVVVLVALVRALVVLLLLILYIFYWFVKLFKPRKDKETHKPIECDKLPIHVRRKPNPCIYSQFYRMSQGLSVTWDNPDIEITHPDGSPADSLNLTANTHYILKAKISNSSFDPALATVVRCFYNPYSFNHPNKEPIEKNPDGTPKVHHLDIAPWSSEIAEFNWITPDEPYGHYCIQVECFHPDDINPDNNLGQENTNVFSVAPGETIDTQAILHNTMDYDRDFTIYADTYQIPTEGADLKLITQQIPLRRKTPFSRVDNYLITTNAKTGKIVTQDQNVPKYTHYKYQGWENFKEKHRRGNFPIPKEWQLQVGGSDYDAITPTRITANGSKSIEIALKVPPKAEKGTTMHFNVVAVTSTAKIAGGITLIVNVN